MNFAGEKIPAIPTSPEFHFPSAPSSPTRSAAAIHSHEFSFNSGAPPEISTADKLFEKGKIRPLIPSPQPNERGRQKSSLSPPSKIRQRQQSRSLSPLRNQSFFIKIPSFSPPSKKWKLKDLLLFRSASEGRARNRGYALLSSFSSFSSKTKKKGDEEEEEENDYKCGSFRSNESVRKNGGFLASAHEIHYTANRAAAGEKRKMTPLAYQRHGLFSCLQFNPAIRSIAKGFSS